MMLRGRLFYNLICVIITMSLYTYYVLCREGHDYYAHLIIALSELSRVNYSFCHWLNIECSRHKILEWLILPDPTHLFYQSVICCILPINLMRVIWNQFVNFSVVTIILKHNRTMPGAVVFYSDPSRGSKISVPGQESHVY